MRVGRLWPVARRAAARGYATMLQTATKPSERERLCRRLGYVGDKPEISLLLSFVGDLDRTVRCSAVTALEMIAREYRMRGTDLINSMDDPSIGELLLQQFASENEIAVSTVLALALGELRYHPAIPALIDALDSPYNPKGNMRRCAAFSLRLLGARQAIDALQRVLAHPHNIDDQEAVAWALHSLSTLEYRDNSRPSSMPRSTQRRYRGKYSLRNSPF